MLLCESVCLKHKPSPNGAITVLFLLGKIFTGMTTCPGQKSTYHTPLAHAPSSAWWAPTQPAGPTVKGPFYKAFPLYLPMRLASHWVVAPHSPVPPAHCEPHRPAVGLMHHLYHDQCWARQLGSCLSSE